MRDYDNGVRAAVASNLKSKIPDTPLRARSYAVGQLSQKVVVLFSEATPSWMFI
jgi:hypothetical protein